MKPLRVLVIVCIVPLVPLNAGAQDGWFQVRGNGQRDGGISVRPVWDKVATWKRPLLLDKLDGDNDADPDQAAKNLIDGLRKTAPADMLPASFPLIVGDACIYRSYRDIRSAAVRDFTAKFDTGEVEKFKARNIVWKSIPHQSSLSYLLEKTQTQAKTQDMINLLKLAKQEHSTWANPLIGSLSADGTIVYAIGDFAFPGVEQNPKPFAGKIPVQLGDLNPMFKENTFYAYEAYTGKLIWDTHHLDGKASPIADSYFLGAPLAREGTLYLLNEKAGTLRLASIDTKKKRKGPNHIEFEKTLDLLKLPAAEQVRESNLRRTQPLLIAQADALLACPTNAGVLLGVDRAKMTERWKFSYRDEEKNNPPMTPHWHASGPIIHKDRIVFTAADALNIYCLDLDGNKKWAAKRNEKDLYVATVHDGIVLIVGKTHCRALSLANGSEKWNVEMGQPAGVGVRDGSLYYVPLQRDTLREMPSIWAIDLAKGKKARRVQVPEPDALGNLAIHRGLIVTQSATHIAAFPLGAN